MRLGDMFSPSHTYSTPHEIVERIPHRELVLKLVSEDSRGLIRGILIIVFRSVKYELA